MIPENRAELRTLLESKITTGGNLTSAKNIRDFQNAMIDSYLNFLDDVDEPDGYLGVDAAGRVNPALINAAIQLGAFLRDNGTFTPIRFYDISGYVEDNVSLYSAINAVNKNFPLFNQFTDRPNVTTGETILTSNTISAGKLASSGDKLEAEYGGVFVSSGTATRQIRIYFAGNLLFDTGTLTLSLSSAWTCYLTIMRVDASALRYMVSFTTQGAALAAYTSVGELTGLALGSANDLKITGQASGVGAATGDIVLKLSKVNYEKSAT